MRDEFRERLRLAEENRSATQQVVTAVNEERRTLRVGGLATITVIIVAALAFVFFYRRGQEQNTRVYAAITRLQTGALTQQQLMERSRRANHHVAEPWWQNEDLKEMLDQGLEPVVAEMTAYFPGIRHGIAINTERISSAADVAVVKGNVSELGIKQIALADGRGSTVSGGPVVLLGYPTALDAILTRASADTLHSIATASKGDPKQVMEELARRNLIRPVTTQGHIGDVLPDKIVCDAQTTSGGSGGPLFNNEGKVIGINFAMVREFGGSNFAIPVGYGKSLLKP